MSSTKCPGRQIVVVAAQRAVAALLASPEFRRALDMCAERCANDAARRRVETEIARDEARYRKLTENPARHADRIRRLGFEIRMAQRRRDSFAAAVAEPARLAVAAAEAAAAKIGAQVAAAARREGWSGAESLPGGPAALAKHCTDAALRVARKRLAVELPSPPVATVDEPEDELD